MTKEEQHPETTTREKKKKDIVRIFILIMALTTIFPAARDALMTSETEMALTGSTVVTDNPELLDKFRLHGLIGLVIGFFTLYLYFLCKKKPFLAKLLAFFVYSCGTVLILMFTVPEKSAAFTVARILVSLIFLYSAIKSKKSKKPEAATVS